MQGRVQESGRGVGVGAADAGDAAYPGVVGHAGVVGGGAVWPEDLRAALDRQVRATAVVVEHVGADGATVPGGRDGLGVEVASEDEIAAFRTVLGRLDADADVTGN